MNRSAWRVLSVLAFALVLLSWVVSAPHLAGLGLRWLAGRMRWPFDRCRMYANGWRKIGPHWALNTPRNINHRKAVRR